MFYCTEFYNEKLKLQILGSRSQRLNTNNKLFFYYHKKTEHNQLTFSNIFPGIMKEAETEKHYSRSVQI